MTELYICGVSVNIRNIYVKYSHCGQTHGYLQNITEKCFLHGNICDLLNFKRPNVMERKCVRFPKI